MPTEIPHPDPHLERVLVDEPPELGALFHRLNNQLGIILANAELVEAKSADDTSRSRGTQIIASAMDAIAIAQEIRSRTRGYRDA